MRTGVANTIARPTHHRSSDSRRISRLANAASGKGALRHGQSIGPFRRADDERTESLCRSKGTGSGQALPLLKRLLGIWRACRSRGIGVRRRWRRQGTGARSWSLLGRRGLDPPLQHGRGGGPPKPGRSARHDRGGLPQAGVRDRLTGISRAGTRGCTSVRPSGTSRASPTPMTASAVPCPRRASPATRCRSAARRAGS